jgi:hypothetical protein
MAWGMMAKGERRERHGGMGKLPESYFNTMKNLRRVGSRNPLNFPNCRAPSTGTTSPNAARYTRR